LAAGVGSLPDRGIARLLAVDASVTASSPVPSASGGL
jgi:hypothetical protein